MSYTIHEITSLKEIKQFADYPNKLYSDSKFYVPGLMSDDLKTFSWKKNPAFEYCEAKYWFAMDNDRIVGRVAGIINHKYVEKWGQKNGRFGFIDFIEDYEVAKLLLDTVAEWLKSEGMEGMQGPLGFCDFDPEGMLIDGFDEKSTLTTIYNHPYYPEYMERYGLIKDVDWFEYKMTVDTLPEQIHEVADRVLERSNLRVYKPKNMKELRDKYAKKIFDLLNATYENLYCVVPLTDKQIDDFTVQYLGLLTKDYVSLVVDSNDELIAFGIGMPNIDRVLMKYRGRLTLMSAIKMAYAMRTKHPKEVDLLLIATREDYQKKGVNAVLLCEMYKFVKNAGVETINLNPQLESNIKVRHSFKHFNAIHNKTRRAYFMPLTDKTENE